jgi:hypothetical protein
MHVQTPGKVTTRESYSVVLQRLNKYDIKERLCFYGFIECAKMSRFLTEFVDEEIDMPSFRYLLASLTDCLETHAKGYNDAESLKYFRPLFQLRDEIEFVMSISKD